MAGMHGICTSCIFFGHGLGVTANGFLTRDGLQGAATTSGDVAHDLSKAKALSNALSVMCGKHTYPSASCNKLIAAAMQAPAAHAHQS